MAKQARAKSIIRVKRLMFISSIPAIVILNLLTALLANALSIPFFIDTWATSLGAMAVGLPASIAGGIIYNITMVASGVWPISDWVFLFSSIWVAFITYLLYRRGWIKISNPFCLISSGIIIGLTNAAIVLLIHHIFFGYLPTYPPTAQTYAAFMRLTGSNVTATILEKLLTELSDKTVSIFMAAVALDHIPRRFLLVRPIKRGDSI